MIKAILEFDLEDFDSKQAHKRAINVDSYISALNDFSTDLREIWKHGVLTEEQFDIVSKIRDKFYSAINEHGIQEDII